MVEADLRCLVLLSGARDSAARQVGSELYDLVIEPALARSFELIRLDDIAAMSMAADSSVVSQLVRGCDLVVVDLTEPDAESVYLTGRRHESGLPIVHLLRAGASPPFELASARYVTYSLEDPHAVRNASRELLELSTAVRSTASVEPTGGGGLTAAGSEITQLRQRLERIESLLADSRSGETSGSEKMARKPDLFTSPRTAFFRAFRQRDRALMIEAALHWLNLAGPSDDVIDALSVCSSMGAPEASEALLGLLRDAAFAEDPASPFNKALGGVVNFYSMAERELDVLDEIEGLVNQRLALADDDKSAAAALLNQLQRLLFGAGQLQRALSIAQSVVELVPDEPAYHFNLSLDAEAVGDLDAAVKAIRVAVSLGSTKPVHWAQAFDVFAASGLADEAEKAFGTLADLDRELAADVLHRFADEEPDNELLQRLEHLTS